jgi:hypothetical protein
MARPLPLEQGRIVWAEVADPNGFRKLRPGVILTASDQIRPDQPLDIVAVTSRLPDPLPADYILLPWHAQGHPRTGLNRRCAAVCTWRCRIMLDDVKDTAGVVPGEPLLRILTTIAAQDAASRNQIKDS